MGVVLDRFRGSLAIPSLRQYLHSLELFSIRSSEQEAWGSWVFYICRFISFLKVNNAHPFARSEQNE